jgi:hypothetical protein
VAEVQAATQARHDLDTLLNELAVLLQHCESYGRFLRGSIAVALGHVAPVGEADLWGRSLNAAVDAAMQRHHGLGSREGDAGRAGRALMDAYVGLEDGHMQASVEHALIVDALDIPEDDDRDGDSLDRDGSAVAASGLTSGGGVSSVVEDALFIIQRAVNRSLATGQVDSFCATVNHANNILQTDLEGHVRRLLGGLAEEVAQLVKGGAKGLQLDAYYKEKAVKVKVEAQAQLDRIREMGRIKLGLSPAAKQSSQATKQQAEEEAMKAAALRAAQAAEAARTPLTALNNAEGFARCVGVNVE